MRDGDKGVSLDFLTEQTLYTCYRCRYLPLPEIDFQANVLEPHFQGS